MYRIPQFTVTTSLLLGVVVGIGLVLAALYLIVGTFGKQGIPFKLRVVGTGMLLGGLVSVIAFEDDRAFAAWSLMPPYVVFGVPILGALLMVIGFIMERASGGVGWARERYARRGERNPARPSSTQHPQTRGVVGRPAWRPASTRKSKEDAAGGRHKTEGDSKRAGSPPAPRDEASKTNG